MKLNLILLGMLTWRPFDGYDIVKWLDTEGQFLRSNTHHSQVYRELGRLVRDGWAQFETDPRDGRPDAKVYRITEVGQAALLDWARSPYLPPSRFHDVDFTARLIFTIGIDLPSARSLIETELTYRQAQVAANRGRDRTPPFRDPIPGLDVDRATRMMASLDRYGMRAVDDWIAWLESISVELASEQAQAEAR